VIERLKQVNSKKGFKKEFKGEQAAEHCGLLKRETNKVSQAR